MDRVYSQQERPVSEMQWAAVAIQAVNPNQRHIEILHRDASSGVMLLDLAWHHVLRNKPPSSQYVWIAPDVPAPRLRQLAARCRQIFRANPDAIPYGFSPPNDCFDEQTGEYLLGPTRHGLTCASFVLAVFELAGLKLIRYDTWPTDRPGDREWQEFIIAELESSNPPASPEHVAAIRNEIGNVRFRPEDVAAAATVSPLPAEFKICAERADQILERLDTA
jgi:hypothetical protein